MRSLCSHQHSIGRRSSDLRTSQTAPLLTHRITSICRPRSTCFCSHGLTQQSMASAASILAVVRAAAPQIRSRQDQLVFALHAAVLTSGYRLVAVGEAAQLEGLSPDAPDAPLTGWNSSSESYSFAYVSEDPAAASETAAPPAPIKLLLKAVAMGDSSLVTCLATDTAGAQPQTLELSVEDFVTTTTGGDGSSSGGGGGSSGSAAAAGGSGSGGPLVAKTYKNLDQLSSRVTSALAELTAAAASNSSGGGNKKQCTTTSSSAAAAAGQRQQQEREHEQQGLRQPAEPQQPQQPDPDYDPLRIGPPRRPLRVGGDDIMPLGGGGGLGPGFGGVGGGGMLPGGPLMPGGGGGMHVGPGHPFFADRMRHPDVMPGRGGLRAPPLGPGGVRWDPINPEGLEGWRPDDFQRPRPGGGRGQQPDIDPDIGLPGPGRGTDWDSMYG